MYVYTHTHFSHIYFIRFECVFWNENCMTNNTHMKYENRVTSKLCSYDLRLLFRRLTSRAFHPGTFPLSTPHPQSHLSVYTLVYSWHITSLLFTVISRSFLAWKGRPHKITFQSGLSQFRFDSSLWPMRARRFLVATTL
jgi:hypothetical protein